MSNDDVAPDEPDAADASAAGPPTQESDLARSLLAQVRAASQGAPAKARAAGRARSRRRRTSGGSTAYSGASPDDRDPQLIAASMDDLVSERGWSEPIAVGGVEGRWPQIVGVDVAAHCVPEEFEAGRLTVRTDSTAWATQVRMLAPTLLARLNDELGAGTVTHLKVLGPQGPSWKKGLFRVKGRGPRDTYG
ncbi:MAG: DciA family protein [Actinomycetia bacterium]|nr:DciA family protein [Actinomycetes bacterium]